MVRRLRATAPAMRQCSAQLNLLGSNGFVARYGGPALADAFGQCVFPKTAAGVASPTAGPTTYSLPFTVAPIGASGVSGEGFLEVDAHGGVLSVALFGAASGQQHGVLLLPAGASCAAAAQTVDAGGVVALKDGALLVSLDPSQQAGTPVALDLATALDAPLAGRQALVRGATVGGVYDRAYPVACGTLPTA